MGMNWLLALPEDEEFIFREELGRLQQEIRMRYISTYDRLVRAEGLEEGLHAGRQEGRQEGRRTALREAMAEGVAERFGNRPEGVRIRLESIEDESVLRRLVRQVWVAGSARDFEQAM